MKRAIDNTGQTAVEACFHYYTSPDFLDEIRSVDSEAQKIRTEFLISIGGHHFKKMTGEVAATAEAQRLLAERTPSKLVGRNHEGSTE